MSCAVAPDFAQLLCPDHAIDGDVEMAWLEQALSGRPVAAVWTGLQALVAPLSYQRHAGLDQVCKSFAARGWPVRLRRSGGGVVPQGPGILNLSLAYPCAGLAGTLSQGVYRHLCSVISSSLQKLGIATEMCAVHGSFCDGRYNLAVDQNGKVCKISGTAQYWKRSGGAQAVLAHALVLIDARAGQMSDVCNAFESDLGSTRRYENDALTSVMQAWHAAHPDQPPPENLAQRLTQEIGATLGDANNHAFPATTL